MSILITLSVFAIAAFLSLPVILLAVSVGLARRGAIALIGAPTLRRMAITGQVRRLERRVNQLIERAALNSADFLQRFERELDLAVPGLSEPVRLALVRCARELHQLEYGPVLDRVPHRDDWLQLARHHDLLERVASQLDDPHGELALLQVILRAFTAFCKTLPPMAFTDCAQSAPLRLATVRLLDAIPDVRQSIDQLTLAVRLGSEGTPTVLQDTRLRIKKNHQQLFDQAASRKQSSWPHLPPNYDGPSEDFVHGYLRDTPLEVIFNTQLPFCIPDPVRFEHTWLVAGSGHGKTQTLQYLISGDLERVARGEASVVVIDSQGDMIRTIARLKMFAPGQPLHSRLCLIDRTDIEYPVALNLFDSGLERLDRYSPLDRERLLNGVLELYDYVFSSLLSSELTAKQAVVFRFLARLMFQIPGATLHTLRGLMEPGASKKFAPYIARLEGTPRTFFETEFDSKHFEETKRQVARRLWTVLENRTFERMFSHPKSRLDLFAEMNAGKVILINTAKDLLKETGTQVFGRFFVALIAQAAQERATLSQPERLPTFVYIDEAADYFDSNIATILEQARKQRIALCCANQFIGQLSPKLQESFSANTSIKLCGGVSERDARSLAHMLRSSPEFILEQPKGVFAVHVRNQTARALSLRIPFGLLEGLPLMTAAERTEVLANVRSRYSTQSPYRIERAPTCPTSSDTGDSPTDW